MLLRLKYIQCMEETANEVEADLEYPLTHVYYSLLAPEVGVLVMWKVAEKFIPLFVMLMVLLLKIWQRNKLVASNKKSSYAYIVLLCDYRGSEQHKGEQ